MCVCECIANDLCGQASRSVWEIMNMLSLLLYPFRQSTSFSGDASHPFIVYLWLSGLSNHIVGYRLKFPHSFAYCERISFVVAARPPI